MFVVFDEFPADDLLRPDGSIDAERFPNFARLASISTWFPNATTVFDSTFGAVPAILDGRLPRPRMATDVRSHKPSIFHVLDRLGYEVFKVESASAVCPPAICPGARTRRPGVLAPARRRRPAGALPQVGGRHPQAAQPAFYFHHALMPHEPWLYLPSGHQSRPAGEDPIPDLNHDVGLRRSGPVRAEPPPPPAPGGLHGPCSSASCSTACERTGLLERALLVVTADHGYSFRVGVKSRRLISDGNVEEIAPVPLFVKAPGQMEGRGDRSLVRNIDLRRDDRRPARHAVFYEQDGRSAFSREVGERREIAVRTRDFAGTCADRAAPSCSAGARRVAARAGRGCSAPARRASSCTATRGRAPTGSARTASCSTAGWGTCGRAPPRGLRRAPALDADLGSRAATRSCRRA